MLFDLADILPDFGEFIEAEENDLGIAFGSGGSAEDACPGGDVTGHAGLGAEDRLIADVDVISDADLASHHDIIAGATGAANADLADEEIVFADPAVVADLHHIVDLGALPHTGGFEGATVDHGASTDFDIVSDLDAGHLGNLDMATLVKTIAETIGPDDSLGMEDDAISKRAAIVDNCMGIDEAMAAKRAVSANRGTGMECAMVADDGASPDNREGPDVAALTDSGSGIDRCPGIDLRIMGGQRGVEVFVNLEEGDKGISHLDDRSFVVANPRLGDEGSSLGQGQVLLLTIIGNKRDVLWAGFEQGTSPCDGEIVGADQRAADKLSNLAGTEQRKNRNHGHILSPWRVGFESVRCSSLNQAGKMGKANLRGHLPDFFSSYSFHLFMASFDSCEPLAGDCRRFAGT